MFYVFQFEDATWRISPFTSARLFPVSGEARRLEQGIYHTRANAYEALARLQALTESNAEQFAVRT